MQPALSPKKYIETKARKLPLYKCLVNPDWKEAGIADVVVMRQHVNGNVTGGVYLVDLKCLGVKDAFWFFNENEADWMEKFPPTRFKEIDYNLAHNIVYAGHDFALEYGIQPQKDFAVARYVLEDDTDAIPLIDIETGEEGIPHLIEHSPGQYADALLKLKKNAGEGNYHYTAAIGFDPTDNEPKDEDEEDEREEILLHDIPEGDLTLRLAKKIPFAELTNKELIAARSENDRLLCDVELQVRFYEYLATKDYEEPPFIEEEWEQLPDGFTFSEGISKAVCDEGFRQFIAMNDEMAKQEKEPEEDVSVVNRYLQQDGGNVYFLLLVYEMVLFHRLPVNRELLNSRLQPFAHLPILQLIQAIDSLLNGTEAGQWQSIIEATNIRKAFPQLDEPGSEERLLFYALQTIRHLRAGNLHVAMSYFGLYSEIDLAQAHTHLFFFMLGEVMPPLTAAVDAVTEKIKNKMDEAEQQE